MLFQLTYSQNRNTLNKYRGRKYQIPLRLTIFKGLARELINLELEG